jgi:hypothetical protein
MANACDMPTYDEAMESADVDCWKDAIKEELKSLQENNTWELTRLPKGRKAIGNKWVLKIKYKANGEIDRYKARLVAKGYSQKEGVDFTETFAPVVKLPTLRTIIAVAAYQGMTIHQMDVKTAFLNGNLNEEIYMTQPAEYEKEGQEELVCKLIKSLYGLKQASRAWNQAFNDAITTKGFKQLKSDECVYL